MKQPSVRNTMTLNGTFTLRAILILVVSMVLNFQLSAQTDPNFNKVPDHLEYAALRALFEATGGPSWTDRSGWDYPNWKDPNTVTYEDFNNWAGVWVSKGDVIQLHLGFNNLSGNLEDVELMDFAELITLDLDGLSGNIGNLDLSANYKLDDLYLSGATITGDISSLDLTNNVELDYLSIWNTSMHGSIDDFDLTANVKLRILSISNNDQISGHIENFDLTNNVLLTFIGLTNNNFQGDISLFDISNNTILETLSLRSNNITGQIQNWNNLPVSLYSLDLGNTGVSGDIHSWDVSYLSNLESLVIGNQIGGDITLWDISGLTSLKGLILRGTYSGLIENFDISQVPTLEALSLTSDNQHLTGNMQNWSISGSNLQSLLIERSKVTGYNQLLPPTLNQLRIRYNEYTFEDLIPYAGQEQLTTFYYSPQSQVGEISQEVGVIGRDFTLRASIDLNTDPPSRYQWFKQGVPVSDISEENSQLTLESLTTQEAGYYSYEVTNPALSDLTLSCRGINLNLVYPPDPPVVSSLRICGGETATFTISDQSLAVNWYSDEFEEVPLFSGTTFTTPALDETTIYWIENIENDIPSDRVSVTVTIVTPSVSIREIYPATCSTSSDGGIEFNAFVSGSSDFIYNVYDENGLVTSENGLVDDDNYVSDLPPGDYTLEIVSDEGCSSTVSFTIDSGNLLSSQVNSIDGTSCAESSDGSFSITISSPYSETYSYTLTGAAGVLESGNGTFDNLLTISSLAMGNYDLEIIDNESGCSLNTPVIIPNDNSFNVVINSTIQTSCEESSDGSVSFTVSGTNSPSFNYEIVNNSGVVASGSGSPGVITQVNSLAIGQYSINVADPTLGCTKIAEFAIINGNKLSLTVNSITASSCLGNNDGAVEFTLTGATSPSFAYTITTSQGVEINSGTGSYDLPITSSGLGVGGHVINIVDDNLNCGISRAFHVSNGGPRATICVASPVCSISRDGSTQTELDVTVNRIIGVAGQTYNYQIIRTEGGSITVASTGTGSFSTQISPKPSIPYDMATYTFEVLQGGNNSCATTSTPINVSPASLAVELDHPDGMYEKCAINQQVDVLITPTLTQSACSTLEVANYRIDLVKDGLPFQQLTGLNEPLLLSDLPSGSFDATVTSIMTGGGICSATTSFDISEAFLTAEIQVTNPTCFDPANDGRAVAQITGGAGPYRYNWFQGTTLISTLSQATELSPGTYRLELWGQSCILPYVEEFNIVAPDPVGDVSIQPPVTNCDMSATLSNIGGTAPYDFLWTKLEEVERTSVAYDPNTGIYQEYTTTVIVENVVFLDPGVVPSGNTAISYTTSDVVSTGNYIVKVRDVNGCEVQSVETFIEQPQFTREYNLCFRWKTPAQEVPEPDDNIVQVTSAGIQASKMGKLLSEKAESCMMNQVSAFKGSLLFNCYSLDHVHDEVSLTYNTSGYHYTLYYYDRAGNLTKTVPPKGVKPLTAGNISRANTPLHELVTTYDYNNLGQLVRQESPDGGLTKFAYNNLGQLRFSQNEEQVKTENNQFSYTKYDPLGRIVELGESQLGVDYTGPGGTVFVVNSFDDLEDEALLDLDKESYTTLDVANRYPTVAQGLSEQTLTTYTELNSGINYLGEEQTYLRNRVSKTSHFDLSGEIVNTYYSYDPHGNVKWLQQEVPGLNNTNIGYDYDLISGNVLQVAYNKGQSDEFYHKYDYDEDNRIKEVSTSIDGVVWERDARYDYYDHGPLAKTTIGKYAVQEVDYTYTIHGWLKAINDPTNNDPEGLQSKDAFSMLIGYYDGDFKNDASSYNGGTSNNELLPALEGKNLYNGNISSWQTATLASNDTWMRTGFQYTYDKLNRIKNADFSVNREGQFYSRGGFATDYSFDPNGNLELLNRNDIDSEQMDELDYTLIAGTNQLDYVDDLSTIDQDKHKDDIEAQTPGNYEYDGIGNLIKDNQEQLDITWTVYGKVGSVVKADGSSTQFIYDASGNRVKKIITDEHGNINTHYYVRDASGNVMAVYKGESTDGSPATPELKEIPIYGSDRLGIYTPDGALTNNQDLVETISGAATITGYDGVSYEMEEGSSITLGSGFNFTDGVDGQGFNISGAGGNAAEGSRAGNKQYELKDHLGNVRAVVTNQKQGTPTGGSFENVKPIIASASAYYPYGMDMPTVKWDEESYMGTMETAAVLDEVNAFDNYTDVERHDDVFLDHTHLDGETTDASYSFKLTGADGSIIGLAKSLKVQAGDKISAEVYGKYIVPNTTDPTDIAASLTQAFIDAFSIPAGAEATNITSFFSDLFAGGVTFTKPDDPSDVDVIAGINCLMFDNNFQFVDGGFSLLTSAAAAETIGDVASVEHERLALEDYIVPEDGYIFIYTSNESDIVTDVYFDDMQVTHEKLVADDPYNADLLAYRYGFNGKEKDQKGEWGLNHYDYGFRIYNPALGRFLSVDPLTSEYPWYTPYQFAGNIPIWAVDRDGLEEIAANEVWRFAAYGSTEVGIVDDSYIPIRNKEGIFFMHKINTGVNAGHYLARQYHGKFSDGNPIYTNAYVVGDKAFEKFSSKDYEGGPSGVFSAYWLHQGGHGLGGKSDFNYAEYYAEQWSDPEKLVAGSTVLVSSLKGPLKEVAKSTTPQVFGKSASSKVLGENLQSIGINRPSNSAAHHIVAGNDQRAAIARGILKREGIDINDAANGVFLPKNSKFANPPAATHSKVHTNNYYENINNRLLNASDVKKELGKISKELSDGTFSY